MSILVFFSVHSKCVYEYKQNYYDFCDLFLFYWVCLFVKDCFFLFVSNLSKIIDAKIFIRNLHVFFVVVVVIYILREITNTSMKNLKRERKWISNKWNGMRNVWGHNEWVVRVNDQVECQISRKIILKIKWSFRQR